MPTHWCIVPRVSQNQVSSNVVVDTELPWKPAHFHSQLSHLHNYSVVVLHVTKHDTVIVSGASRDEQDKP